MRQYTEQIENSFYYHPPKSDQLPRYEKIREIAKEFAHLIDDCCPNSREKLRALDAVGDAVMLANASIARNE